MRPRVRGILDVIVAVAAIALIVWRFLDIDRGSHSVSDTVRPWMLETSVIVVVAALAISLVHRLAGQRRLG